MVDITIVQWLINQLTTSHHLVPDHISNSAGASLFTQLSWTKAVRRYQVFDCQAARQDWDSTSGLVEFFVQDWRFATTELAQTFVHETCGALRTKMPTSWNDWEDISTAHSPNHKKSVKIWLYEKEQIPLAPQQQPVMEDSALNTLHISDGKSPPLEVSNWWWVLATGSTMIVGSWSLIPLVNHYSPHDYSSWWFELTIPMIYHHSYRQAIAMASSQALNKWCFPNVPRQRKAEKVNMGYQAWDQNIWHGLSLGSSEDLWRLKMKSGWLTHTHA